MNSPGNKIASNLEIETNTSVYKNCLGAGSMWYSIFLVYAWELLITCYLEWNRCFLKEKILRTTFYFPPWFFCFHIKDQSGSIFSHVWFQWVLNFNWVFFFLRIIDILKKFYIMLLSLKSKYLFSLLFHYLSINCQRRKARSRSAKIKNKLHKNIK